MSYIYIYLFIYTCFYFYITCSSSVPYARPFLINWDGPGSGIAHRHWIWKTWVHLGWARSCDLAASLVEFCGVSQAHKQKQTKKITVAIRSVQHPMQRFVCTVRIWIVQFISCLRLCTFSTSVCVCVNHLNRCKTSLGFLFWFHFNTQGDVAEHQGPRPTKLPDCMEYRAWSALSTCLFEPIFCSENFPTMATG